MAATKSILDPHHVAKYLPAQPSSRNVVEGFLSGGPKSAYKGFSVEFLPSIASIIPATKIRHIEHGRVYGKTDRY